MKLIQKKLKSWHQNKPEILEVKKEIDAKYNTKFSEIKLKKLTDFSPQVHVGRSPLKIREEMSINEYSKQTITQENIDEINVAIMDETQKNPLK